ncbi:MBL fold metallo-hydrolase [Xanthobacter autotrophicus]|uniref:MBL fold metallo-hydrolase n=1 Tax=Xanthobacter autotrophicus TaxID=280 RepID=UPI0037265793
MASIEAALEWLTEVAPDILRIRVQLPFPPSEVSVWLLIALDGWTLIDSGVADAPTRAPITHDLADPRLSGRSIARLLLTHFNPEHVGLAYWLRH